MFPAWKTTENFHFNLRNIEMLKEINLCLCLSLSVIAQLCEFLMECRPPDSSVCGVLDKNTKVSLPFLLKGFSQLRDQTCTSVSSAFRWILYHLSHCNLRNTETFKECIWTRIYLTTTVLNLSGLFDRSGGETSVERDSQTNKEMIDWP